MEIGKNYLIRFRMTHGIGEVTVNVIYKSPNMVYATTSQGTAVVIPVKDIEYEEEIAHD